ncbi:MAG TPA: DUF3820 family protein [Pirellulales bacterium]|nr:DUF3820 family protein [Pirellulales bacterium]
MPTDAALLAQLQTLWQAVPPSVEPALRLPTAEEAAELQAEILAGILDGLPAGDLAPFDWFALIDDAERHYLLGRHRYPERCGFCGGHYLHNPRCVALCDEWAVKMPFGKHRGLRVTEVPHDYLRWLLRNGMELDGDLRREIERVLKIEQAA